MFSKDVTDYLLAILSRFNNLTCRLERTQVQVDLKRSENLMLMHGVMPTTRWKWVFLRFRLMSPGCCTCAHVSVHDALVFIIYN